MTWERARQKIQEGVDYTDTIEIPFADPHTGDVELIELTHRLLTETEYTEVQQSIDLTGLSEVDIDADVDLQELQDRITELQQKDDLTAAEEQELEDKLQVAQQQEAAMMEAMGAETFKALMGVGKKCLVPSSEDVQNGFDLSPSEQEERFNFTPTTRDEMRDAIKLEMESMVEEQPYPVKLQVGLKAWDESQTLLGETELNETDPN